MITEKEFKVNEYISLKLKGKNTIIYVDGERFRQCKFLLLNIPVKKISAFDEIDSIDEAADKLDWSQERGDLFISKIPPEVEFWGHCSNLQVWAENDYDTRLIHSNLAFPLLKRLTEVDDPKAKRVFKDEIGKRLASGFPPVIEFLTEEKYLQYLNREELVTALSQIDWEKVVYLTQEGYFYFLKHEELVKVLLESEEAEAILEIERLVNQELTFGFYDQTETSLYIKNRHVMYLDLDSFPEIKLEVMPDSLKNLKLLEDLNLACHKISILPEWIGEFKNLKYLILDGNILSSLPDSIGNLKNLKSFSLGDNPIKNIPLTIKNLKKLIDLDIRNTNISENSIPNEIKTIIKKNKGIIFT